MDFINDNDNRCISDECGWDFNLITSNVFVSCVRQLNTIFVFIQFSFFMISRMSPGKIVFGVVPRKTINCVPGKLVYLHHTCPQ